MIRKFFLLLFLLTLTHLLFSQSSVIYFDDFSELTNVWTEYKGNSTDAKLINKNLRISSSAEDAIKCYWGQIFINYEKDFSVEVNIKQNTGETNQGYGILWGAYGWENSNIFMVTSSGYFCVGFYKNKVYQSVKDWTKSDAIKPLGTYNVLKVERTGLNIVYYINDKAVYTTYFSNYFAQLQGFVLQTNIQVDVDYIKITNDLPKIDIADITFKGIKKNIGSNINTSYTEIAPIISPDGQTLYFARGWYFKNIGGSGDEADIWYSKKRADGTWGLAQNIGKPLNNKGVNVVINVMPDGNTLFLEGLYNSDGSFKSDQGISVTHRTANGWAVPTQVKIDNFYNKNIYETYFFTNDQQVLLMSIERDDTYGDKDLYVSFRRSNGTYTAPKNMGPTLNTFADEATPFMSSDGKTLFFSTSGQQGFGSNDIYVTKRLDDTWLKWSKPKNLGKSINTNAWDTYLSLSAKGDTAFLASNAKSHGNEDIFTIEMPLLIQPDPVVLIKGKVLDIDTKKPVAANIIYQDLKTGKNIGIAQSNPTDGSYQIILPYGKLYGFRAESKGYIAINENIDLLKIQTYQEIRRDLYLSKLKVGQIIVLNNVFFEQANANLLPISKPELDRVVKILKDNPKMRIELRGHTDNRGNASQLLKLSEQRVLVVKNYIVKIGIDSTRIQTKAFGGTLPINKDNSETEHAKNRRVEFRILQM